MQALYLFKLFCFIFAAITTFNLYTELTLSHISIWQVLIHGGLLMILLEFGFKSQCASQQPNPQKTSQPHNPQACIAIFFQK